MPRYVAVKERKYNWLLCETFIHIYNFPSVFKLKSLFRLLNGCWYGGAVVRLQLLPVDPGAEQQLVDELALQPLLHELLLGDLAIAVSIHRAPGNEESRGTLSPRKPVPEQTLAMFPGT